MTDIKISTLEHSVWHISDLKRSMALEKAAAFCRTGTEPPKKNLKLFSATTAAIVPLKFLALGKQIEKKVAAVAAVTGMPHPPTEILGPDLASIEWHLEENARLVDIFLATDERAKEKLALVLEKIGSNLYRLHEHVKHARVPLWRLWWYLP